MGVGRLLISNVVRQGGTSNNDHGSGHAGAGGGGSSYVGSLSNTTITAGIRTGNGQVVITW